MAGLRRLGLAATAMRLDALDIDLDICRAAWHGPDPGLRWTDGEALLPLSSARELLVVPGVQGSYWQ